LGIHLFKLECLFSEGCDFERMREAMRIINVVLPADGLNARDDGLEEGLV
jgi:hypothetical protein